MTILASGLPYGSCQPSLSPILFKEGFQRLSSESLHLRAMNPLSLSVFLAYLALITSFKPTSNLKVRPLKQA
jgi:hypothetical protein